MTTDETQVPEAAVKRVMRRRQARESRGEREPMRVEIARDLQVAAPHIRAQLEAEWMPTADHLAELERLADEFEKKPWGPHFAGCLRERAAQIRANG